MFEDELCRVLVHDIYGDASKLVVHVEVEKTTKREVLEHYYDVIQSLFEALKERGIKEVEAWVSEDHEIDFAQFYGFDQFMGQLLVDDRETIPPVFMLKREL